MADLQRKRRQAKWEAWLLIVHGFLFAAVWWFVARPLAQDAFAHWAWQYVAWFFAGGTVLSFVFPVVRWLFFWPAEGDEFEPDNHQEPPEETGNPYQPPKH